MEVRIQGGPKVDFLVLSLIIFNVQNSLGETQAIISTNSGIAFVPVSIRLLFGGLRSIVEGKPTTIVT
jgi:hypothetical protein